MDDPRLLLQLAELAKMLGQGGPETDYYIQALRQALAGTVR